MLSTLLALTSLSAIVFAADDGAARTPPMAWRDWNQYQCDINQVIMQGTMDALVDTSRGPSLASLGYLNVGLDDCWQKCGSYGPNNYTYHDASGNPVVDTTKFPNMTGMTSYAHSLNLTAGFYSNNCACSDHCTDVACFAADVNAILSWGFDAVKLDGCGKEENIQLWYDLFNWTNSVRGNKPTVIENCHNGPIHGSPGTFFF